MEELNIPRRSRIDLYTPAELAIYNAMLEVEKAGASVELTNAVTKLQEARNLVADHVDNQLKLVSDALIPRHPSDIMLSLERNYSDIPSKIVVRKNKYTDK